MKSVLWVFFNVIICFYGYSSRFVVTNTNTAGGGSLFQAISEANALIGKDTIHFQINQSGLQSIVLTGALPIISSPLVIEAQSQNNFMGVSLSERLIQLDGGNTIGVGLHFGSGSNGSKVSNLIFRNFSDKALTIDNSSSTEIIGSEFFANNIAILISNASNNKIGDGTASGENRITGSLTDGLIIVGNSQSNDINRNKIYANVDLGIDLGDNIKDGRDPGDVDSGPNGFQNKPLLDSVSIQNDSIRFHFTHIGANASIRFDFYSNYTNDTSRASGQTWIGSETLAVTDGMKLTRAFFFQNMIHRTFSMLATQNGNTSEFSNLVIRPGLNRPNAVSDVRTLDEDTQQFPIDVLANDTDADNNINVSSLQIIPPLPQRGSVLIQNGIVMYTPNPDYFGSDQFRYKICDLSITEPLCDSALVSLTISPVPDAPIANDDYGTANQSSDKLMYVVENDTDADGDLEPGSLSIVSNKSGVPIVTNRLREGEILLEYSKIPLFNSVDTIEYRICDSGGLCDTAKIIIEINAGGFPIVLPDFATLNEDQAINIDILSNDSDPDFNLDFSSLTIVQNGKNGAATYNQVTQLLRYTPHPNFNGFDTLVYRLCDITGNCSDGLVYLTILPVNDAPEATRIKVATHQGNCSNNIQIDVLSLVNEPDENDSLDYASFQITQPISGVNAAKDSKGLVSIFYSVDSSFFGKDSLRYKICDTQGLCDSAYIAIDVRYNAPPQVVNDVVLLEKGESKTINLLSNDSDNNVGLRISSFQIIKNPTVGKIQKLTNGNVSVNYGLTPDFSGTEELIYEICDSGCFCGQGKLFITVGGITLPVDTTRMLINDDLFTFKEGCISALTNVFANDDFKGLANFKTLRLLPFSGSNYWSINSLGELSVAYHPDTIFNQNFTINYTLCDTLDRCDTGKVAIYVLENEAPSTKTGYYKLVEGSETVFDIAVLQDVVDSDGIDATSFSLLKNPNRGTAFVNTTAGSVRLNFGNIESYTGSDTLIFEICDTRCKCTQDSIIIFFEEYNRPIVYDGFSPNGDSKNDVWFIDNLELYPDYFLQIVNQWGQVIFTTKGFDRAYAGYWDGDKAPDGTYYYVLSLNNGTGEVLTGTIFLNR